MKTVLKDHTALLVLITIFFIIGLLRLNDLSLYTDCTRYLIWGTSVAQGKGFVDDTQPEPEYYIVNAPFFSIVLTPVLLFFQLSLSAAKVWTLLWGVLALILFYRWIRSVISQSAAIAVTIFLALNPLTLVLSTEVLSEAPFLCAILGIFILIERMHQQTPALKEKILLIVILSIIILLREVGAALICAVILYFIISRKWKIAGSILLCACVLFALWTYRNLVIVGVPETSQNPNLAFIFQHFVTSPNTSVFEEMLQRGIINFRAYALGLGGMLLYRFPLNLLIEPTQVFASIAALMNKIQSYSFILFLPLILIGAFFDFTRSRTALLRGLFILFYLVILIFYPVQDVRFLFVLIPCSLFYLALAIEWIRNRLQLTLALQRILITLSVTIFILPNLICIYEILRTNISYNQDRRSFTDQNRSKTFRATYFSTPWSIIGDWIDKNIPPEAILASPDKEIVPFAPKQKFVELNRTVPLPMFEATLRDNAVEYLFAPTVVDNFTEYQSMINESKRFRFEQIGDSGISYIYRIVSRLEKPSKDSAQSILDLDNTLQLYTFGRHSLKNEQYNIALEAFNKLLARYPRFTEFIFQRFLVYSFLRDSTNAIRMMQDIYTSPTTMSYVSPAQIHIHAMNLFRNAQTLSDSIAQAEQLLNVARLYWNLGFPRQAYHTVQLALKIDPTFFVGLLWAWNYGMQIGDTVSAKSYLQKLVQIDQENPIVRSFRRMSFLQDTLRRTIGQQKRSELRLAISQEYSAIDLSDEALDEAQRAIGEHPTNKHALVYLAELFTKRQKPLATKSILQRIAKLEKEP